MTNANEFTLSPYKNDRHLRLNGWRQNVGGLVALNVASPTLPERALAPNAVVVLNWNVWIGHGHLRDVVTRLRNGEFWEQGADPNLPLVILAQEVYRPDASLPPSSREFSGGLPDVHNGREREHIVEAAHALGMHLRYAPSMRNGLQQSDRGNAILSSLPIHTSAAFELPHVLQRRVAVAATIKVGTHTIRFVSAHLDVRGPFGFRMFGNAGRDAQTKHLLECLGPGTAVIGADLNITGGRFESAWRRLKRDGFSMGVPSVDPAWRHTHHTPHQRLIDYVLVRDPSHVVSDAKVYRLDEHPADDGTLVFNSDHHPLVARFDFADTNVAE